ncbi:MAG: HAMP domain-containing histidine kinase [Candidatus Marinimicrobia bacterium]|nr:HAMP domain-containing histidine kinase [Candidatus Neomarinimicrobiota bacterium]MCF7850033.1 HAMP domain-containing histidine kinase [Candidatus Neomarinimicrobiota bacterium]
MELHIDSYLEQEITPFPTDPKNFIGSLQQKRPEIWKNVLTSLISDAIIIVDGNDQSVYTNNKLLEILGINDTAVHGAKTSDILNCVHTDPMGGGCGSTEFCNDCELRKTIQLAQNRGQSRRECRIRAKGGRALELEVKAEHFEFDYEQFTILTLRDISSEKRRKALERTFFHDILNTAGVIHSASKLLNGDESKNQTFMDMITRSSLNLIEEIKSHRLLLQAENGDLTPHMTLFSPKSKIVEVVKDLEYNPISKGKTLITDEFLSSAVVESDPVIFGRVLLNLVKNALEASNHDEAVSVGCFDSAGGVTISIHNPTYIPLDVQHQIFQRSYSTKGEGRGIGTYSVKLFVEEYLEGRVWFESSVHTGTVFYVFLPTNEG